MKTKELIKELQELDPTGETEVVCGCGDIYFVEELPAYYDGRLGVLIKDESKKPYYHVKGGSRPRSIYRTRRSISA